MHDYLLGLVTLPALAALGFALFIAWIWVTETLREKWGITFEAKVRDLGQIPDYVLTHNIWWERHVGPIFIGGWYREDPKYMEPDHAWVNRWIGIGPSSGPCVMAFRSWDLGLVSSPAERSA